MFTILSTNDKMLVDSYVYHMNLKLYEKIAMYLADILFCIFIVISPFVGKEPLLLHTHFAWLEFIFILVTIPFGILGFVFVFRTFIAIYKDLHLFRVLINPILNTSCVYYALKPNEYELKKHPFLLYAFYGAHILIALSIITVLLLTNFIIK